MINERATTTLNTNRELKQDVKSRKKEEVKNYYILSRGYRDLFEQINSGYLDSDSKKNICGRCRSERRRYLLTEHDKAKGQYSNRCSGFSSRQRSGRLDLLIVSLAHSGSEGSFRKQMSLEEEAEEFYGYYIGGKPDKYHQQQAGNLLREAERKKKSWAFTDLLKCHVWNGSGSSCNIDAHHSQVQKGHTGSNNTRIATEYCREYLDREISLLNPKVIVALGQYVTDQYFNVKRELVYSNDEFHGYRVKNRDLREKTEVIKDRSLVLSYFPTGRKADLWVKEEGWKPVLRQLGKQLDVLEWRTAKHSL